MSPVLEAPVSGAARPRIATWPEGVSSAGQEAIDLAALAGLELDDWQAFVLRASLAERPGGLWAAFEVGLMVSRQNGKGGLLEARELAGLFLLPAERLIVHSAHQFDTSLEAFRRLLFLIEDTPELDRRVKRVSKSHGEEGIELLDGKRIRFRTRTKGGGRGFSADLVILDEAMILPLAAHGALLPTLSARPNPQVWYTGSAVDEEVHEHGLVFARVRERGIAGDPRLAYFEWSVDRREPGDDSPYTPDRVSASVATDPSAWAEANPALGIRIDLEHVEAEQRSMDPRTFAVERLGVGAWPRTDGARGTVLDVAKWTALADPGSRAGDPVTLAFDVTPDRGRGWIGVAGDGGGGVTHVEIIEGRLGTDWLPARIVELVARHSPTAVVCDSRGPAASLVPDLDALGVHVQVTSTTELVQACGHFFDLVESGRLRHLGTPELEAAVKGAAKRTLGDAWAYSRRSSAVDIAPLVAVTLAAWKRGGGSFFVF